MTMKWSLKVIFRQEKITLNEFVFVTIFQFYHYLFMYFGLNDFEVFIIH